jgi:hypothetical protein
MHSTYGIKSVLNNSMLCRHTMTLISWACAAVARPFSILTAAVPSDTDSPARDI